MFDCLLGGKFSNKCKQSVKSINSRIAVIRKKRQATVKFLKKDVADLLSNAHDANAFRRIDALISEMNHVSCYDMIEEYCQFILKQLLSLQKQRECLEEATEAVSTLIYAAARFSDLPELCDLRQVFAERYGSQMEASVSAEFVEKVQKKYFTTDEKLRLMQDIADEFSVQWDFRAYQQKTSNPAPPAFDEPKRQSGSKERRSLAEMNGRITVLSERKEPFYDKGAAVYDRNEIINDAGGALYNRKGSVFYAGDAVNANVANVANVVSNANVAVNKKKESVFHADVAVNGRKKAAFGKDEGDDPQISLRERRWEARKEIINEVDGAVYDRKGSVFYADSIVNGRKEALSNADGVNRKKTYFHADVAVKGREAAFLKDGGADQQITLKGWEATPRSLLQKQIRPEPIDIHVVGSNSHVRSDDRARETKTSASAEKRETAELCNDRIAPYHTPKGSNQDNWRNEGTANTNYRSPIVQEGPGLIGIEEQFTGGPFISNNLKSVNVVPPYSKLKGTGNGNDVTNRAASYDELLKNRTVEEAKVVQLDYDRGGAPYCRSKGSQKDNWLNEGPATNTRHPIIAQDGQGGTFVLEKQQCTASLILSNDRADDTVPPSYTKLRCGRNGNDLELLQKDDGLNPTRPMNMIPPYTKSKFRNPPPVADDDMKLIDDAPQISSSSTAEFERPRPVSVRKRLPKPPLPVTETDNTVMKSSPTRQTKEVYAEGIMNQKQEKAAEEDMNGGIGPPLRVSSTSSNGRRKHEGRCSSATTYGGGCDEEEEVMDRLLLHLSKKGMKKDGSSSSKSRARITRPPLPEPAADAADKVYSGRSHFNFRTKESNVHHRPERVASLPMEGRSLPPTIVGGGVGKGPVRTTSLEPDLLSPNGGCSYPRIPDFDDLAARLITLKKAR